MLYKVTRPISVVDGTLLHQTAGCLVRHKLTVMPSTQLAMFRFVAKSLVPNRSSLGAFRISGECIKQNGAIKFTETG